MQAWPIDKDLLVTVSRWEMIKLRRITHTTKRRPEEQHMGHMMRSAAVIRTRLAENDTARLAQRILSRIFDWAISLSKVTLPSGKLDLWEITKTRDADWWHTFSMGLSLQDPLNTLKWKHSRPGHFRYFETPIVEVFGPKWKSFLLDPKNQINAQKKYFVYQMCQAWTLDCTLKLEIPANFPGEMEKENKYVTKWWEKIEDWDKKCNSFTCLVDNKNLSDWLSAKSECVNPGMILLLCDLTEKLLHLFETLALRNVFSSWVEWVPREYNWPADLLCKEAFEKQVVTWRSDMWHLCSPGLGNFVLTSDGSVCEKGCSCSGVLWFLAESETACEPTRVSHAACVLDGSFEIQRCELEGLKMAVGLLGIHLTELEQKPPFQRD
jgi:hypothetical protein